MKPNIGISDEHRSKVGEILNTLLADELLLYVKTRNAHWNVTGPGFSELHKFFEEQYEQLDDIMDAVAERARMLGIEADGTLAKVLNHTRLKEQAADYGNADTLIRGLLDDHEVIINAIRPQIEQINNEYRDAGTADFLTGLLEDHEKMAWMLRAFLS